VECVEESPGTQPPAGGQFHDGDSPDAIRDASIDDASIDDGVIDDGEDMAAGTADGPEGAKDPLRFSNWMKRSTTGAVMTGIAMGLQQALEPQNREVPFVIEAKGEPDDPDRPIDLRFDPDSPADTVAVIRRPATADPATSPAPRP
jgi:hypothetical protein